MTVHLGHLSLVAAPPATAGPAGPAGPEAPEPSGPAEPGAATAGVVPASPPPEVSEQVAAALERTQDLLAANRELHFAKDPQTGRIVVEVRDLEGDVLRTIPPSEALEIMSGGAI